jgi:hypothetical protein
MNLPNAQKPDDRGIRKRSFGSFPLRSPVACIELMPNQQTNQILYDIQPFMGRSFERQRAKTVLLIKRFTISARMGSDSNAQIQTRIEINVRVRSKE